MLILGVDPGLAVTGYGVVASGGGREKLVDCGCIRSGIQLDTPERLDLIYRELLALARRFSPGAMVVEKIFFNKNTASALQVGEARGVAILAGRHAGVSVYEYTPLQVKQAVAGYGRADKEQIKRMVCLLLGLSNVPRPDDAADALAVALCHINGSGRRSALERGRLHV
jgi:crossover junction endodeoxyribonuclease RuvC